MSDLATLQALTKTSPQLPIPWYFDPQIYALEQQLLFEKGPGYVGHELMVPNRGDYQVLARFDHGKALVHAEQGVKLISNVCRHRQAIILKDRGTTKSIVCPLHRWTYGLDGKLLGAPHFPGNPCLDLGATPVQNWNGLLFNGKRDVTQDLARLGVKQDLDFTGFILDRVQIDEYACNWKTFIEVYLEDYHVVPFHPGLGNFVTCDDLRWKMADAYSVQTVGIRNQLRKPGTPTYAKWHEAVRRYSNGSVPKYRSEEHTSELQSH